MTTLRTILLALATGGALMSASIAVQSSPAVPDVAQDRAETQGQAAASQPTSSERCKKYRWVRVGHPGKGYERRVCVDKKQRSRN